MTFFDRPALFWGISALLLVAAIPLAAAWRLRQSFTPMMRLSSLAMSASLTHITLAILDNRVLGRDYSSLRFVMIGTWLLICAVATVASVARGRGVARLLLASAGAWLVLDWLYFAAVSSVV